MKTEDGIRYSLRHHRRVDRKHGHAVEKGGWTIAEILADEDGEDGQPVVLATGIARCNSKERFDRKLGHEIALGRALKALRNIASSW